MLLTFGSRLLQGEQLHQAVMAAWNNPKLVPAMSRAYAGHHQIASAIIAHNGDNKYLTERGGMTFGVRKTYVRDPDGTGVIPIELAPQEENETIQGQILAEAEMRGVRYSPPSLESLDKAALTLEQKQFLKAEMDYLSMSEELLATWEKIDGQDNGFYNEGD